MKDTREFEKKSGKDGRTQITKKKPKNNETLLFTLLLIYYTYLESFNNDIELLDGREGSLQALEAVDSANEQLVPAASLHGQIPYTTQDINYKLLLALP